MDANSLILTLLNMPGWGPAKVYRYVSKHSFDYENARLGLALEFVDKEKALFKEKLVDAKLTIIENEKVGTSVISILDPRFPKKLYETTDKVVLLFYQGDVNLLNTKSIAVIGSREISDEFIQKGYSLTKKISDLSYTIVSGLAAGSDSVAHKATLDANGKTIAVLPSACDKPMPTSNKSLAEEIVRQGGLLISEYPKGSPISKFNYPKRDRIQSLLSDITVVIEATDSSGTMIAVKKTIADGKKVYALEGNRITLIKDYINEDNYIDLLK